MSGFDIKEDLEGRPLAQQVEILWISGPTWHDTQRIAQVLGLPEDEVEAMVARVKA